MRPKFSRYLWLSLLAPMVICLSLPVAAAPVLSGFETQDGENQQGKNPQKMMQEARALAAVNNVDGAIEILERLVDVVDPSNLTGRLALGRMYVAAGKHREAKEVIESVIKEDRENLSAWAELADLYARLNQPDQALALVQPLLDEHPDFVHALVAKGHALLRKKQFDEAEKSLLSAIELDPDRYQAHFWLASVAMTRRRVNEAINRFRSCLETMQKLGLDPLYGVPACETLASLYLNLGHYKNAAHWLEQVLAITNNKFQAHYNLGVAHGMMFHYDKAEEHLKQALILNPNDYMARLRLAHIYETQNRLDDALVQYRRGEEINPTQAHIHDRIGNVLIKLKRFDEAKEALSSSINYGSFTPSPYHLMATVLYDEKSYDDAIRYLEQGLAIDPLHVESHYLLCQVLLRTKRDGDRERAEEEKRKFDILRPRKGDIAKFQSMLEISPGQVDNRVELANLLHQIGANMEAQKMIDKALEIRPEHFGARKMRGKLFIDQGMVDQGKNDLMMAKNILVMRVSRLEKVEEPAENVVRTLEILKKELQEIEDLLAK